MKLFSPINIGKVKIKNRITFPAIATGCGSEEGYVTDRMIDYYDGRGQREALGWLSQSLRQLSEEGGQCFRNL